MKRKPPVVEDDREGYVDGEGYGDGYGYGYGYGTPSPAGSRPGRLPKIVVEVLVRWYWPLLGLILGLLLSAYYLKKTPERYASTATMLVKQNRATVISEDQVEEIDMRSDNAMNTVVAQMGRVELLEKVADRPDIRAIENLVPVRVSYLPGWLAGFFGAKVQEQDLEFLSGPSRDALVSMIGRRVEVSIRRKTRLLDVTVNHEEPQTAMLLANALVEEYLKELTEASKGTRLSKSEGLLMQAEMARGNLQEATSALAVYNRALGVHRALEERESEVAELARRYREKYPKMIAARAKFAEVKEKFMEEFRIASSSGADSDYWKTALAVANGEKTPEEELATARRLLLARTQVLDGETRSLMSVFNSILVTLEETKVNSINEDLISQFDSRARETALVTFPNARNAYGMGGVGGVACGVGLVLLLMRLDNRFRTVSQVEEETGLPVLAAVPILDEKRLEAARKEGARKSGTPEVELNGAKWSHDLVFRPGLEKSLYAEAYRILRAAVTLLGDEKERKVTLFSSALPGEGKTTTSANYAMGTAKQGRRTLLIDFDLRKPKVHRQFGLKRAELGKGMAELLAKQATLEEAVTTGQEENLDCLFCGGKAPNPGELLNASRVKAILAEAKEQYDHVVVDSAPLLAVPDTRVLFPYADNPCLVVRANVVPKMAVVRTIATLEESNSPAVGIVLNGYTESRRRMGYNYSYGSYRLGRYGYRYGYGGYGTYGKSYGAYGSDDDEE